MINNLKVGDKVITSGGIIGFITKIDEKNSLFHFEAAEGIVIKVAKNSIIEKISKEKKND
jgi:preprotein translocase subunit YajC